MQLTRDQQAAVDLRNRPVIVSAAAGAGKTRVLVERLMAYVVEDGRHIDDFLVVTFTRAAAGEVRERITERLRALCESHPDGERLRSEMERVYTAKIGTLDAYCRELLLENAADAGLPAGYRAGGEAELELLEERVLEETLDGLYEQNEPVFKLCADTYGDERGDRTLAGLILHIWKKTRCHPEPMVWLQSVTDSFPGGDAQTILFEQALCVTETFYREYLSLAPAVRHGVLADSYAVTLRDDLVFIELLLAQLRKGDWDEAAGFLEEYTFPALKSYRGEAVPEAAAFKALRDRWKKAVSERLKLWISGSEEEHLRGCQALAPVLSGLTLAVNAFDRALTAEKLRFAGEGRPALLDFSDVERIALSLLTRDGVKTAFAERVSWRFAEILVDEYQDINPMQDAIITALSRDGSNVFYVGDARQSIYRFQMAEPRYFLEKLKSGDDNITKIILRENFRSQKPVLDTVNHVFSRIECPEMGALEQEFFMRIGDDEKQREGLPAEVLVTGEYTVEREADNVARRLRALIDCGEAAPGDCVILMRSPKNRFAVYSKALTRAGLPCAAPGDGDYMNSPEIQAVLAALEITDNARLDIPLIAALRSPMASCSSDELAELRLLVPDGALCECLPLSGNEKIAAFGALLQNWRKLAPDLPPYALAARIISDTGLLTKVSPGAREKLFSLPGLLREYTGELRGLADWLRKNDGRSDIAAVQTANGYGTGMVRILSIHGSKGLQFPVVVVADLAKKLNLQDQTARLLAHPRFGLGLKLRDSYSEYPTPSYRAVQAAMDSETRSEELRLLYVAMTRAQKRLILSVPDGECEGGIVTRGDLILNNNTAAWILKALDQSYQAPAGVGDSVDTAPDGLANSASAAAPQPETEPFSPGWQYPHPQAVNTPSKVTATGWKGRFPDDWVHEGAAQTAGLYRERKKEFEPDGASQRQTAQDRGNAMHLFMQFCDFARCAGQGGAEAERARLREIGLLTQEQADCVDTLAVSALFNSPRGRELLNAKGLRREQKFSLLVKNGDIPDMLLPDGEKVLLQGVIDCCYETPEGYVLLDFKTDRLMAGQETARARHYKPQMDAYAFALSQMTGRAVVKRLLYFFATGCEVIM